MAVIPRAYCNLPLPNLLEAWQQGWAWDVKVRDWDVTMTCTSQITFLHDKWDGKTLFTQLGCFSVRVFFPVSSSQHQHAPHWLLPFYPCAKPGYATWRHATQLQSQNLQFKITFLTTSLKYMLTGVYFTLPLNSISKT